MNEFYKSIDDKYYKEMNEFLSRMRRKIDGYLAFPNQHKVKEFSKTLKNHLVELVKLEPTIRQVKLLSKIVYFLRRGYIILEDPQAEKILEILNFFSQEELQNEKSLLVAWAEVALYLLEMYRIDGLNEEYERLLTMVETTAHMIDGYIKEEIQIEKSKFFIGKFDYNQSKNEIEKINHTVGIDIQLKKVFLYKQIGEEEKGEDLLRKASALLSQKKYDENKMASLKGYLNLCARALMSGYKMISLDDNFSDNEYSHNPYNVRVIYNDLKNEVSNSLVLNYNDNSRGRHPGFNPGTYKMTYGTATRKEQAALSNPLSYVMFQDLLCLPNTFSDHREIQALGLKEIIQTSSTPTWKWSSIIRTNDEKIINSFFTREIIISADSRWIEELFEQLIKLSDIFTTQDDFSSDSKIITLKTIFDILTRFSIALSDENVIQLTDRIIDLSDERTDYNHNKLGDFFKRLKVSFNSTVLNHYFNTFLESDSIPLGFLLTLVDSNWKNEKFELNDITYYRLIDELNSQDNNTRNNLNNSLKF